MANGNEIGARIRELRESILVNEKPMTQAQLAAALFVKRETVNQWENGTRDLKTEYTIALADFFNVSCDYILRGIKAENLDINEKTGLSDKAIDSLHFLFRSKNYIQIGGKRAPLDKITVLNHLIERDYIGWLCKEIIISLSSLDSINQTYSEFYNEFNISNEIERIRAVTTDSSFNSNRQALNEAVQDVHLFEEWKLSKSIEATVRNAVNELTSIYQNAKNAAKED